MIEKIIAFICRFILIPFLLSSALLSITGQFKATTHLIIFGWCVLIHTMNSREVIKRLKKEGWVLHHTKGDHHQFKHPSIPGKVTVPHPKKDLPIGTIKSIYKQAGWHWS
jgi:predicted RNA binding protein YcfA (HicA-like mRNA interferase family)